MKEFADIFKDVLKNKYALFTGRAGRKEFWVFYLLLIAISMVIQMVEGVVGSPPIVSSAFGLATFIPMLAVSIRRYHDSDHSGWWFICPIMNIVFLFVQGTVGDNRFGSDPKRIS